MMIPSPDRIPGRRGDAIPSSRFNGGDKRRASKRQAGAIVIALAVALALSAAALKFITYSFAWLFPFWAAIFFWLAIRARGTARRVLANGAGVLAVLAIIEIVVCNLFPVAKYTETGGPLVQDDADLGYSARPGARVTETRHDRGHLTYAAKYDIDSKGLRVMPQAAPSARDAVLLFGCSLTCGVGVNDMDSWPARLQMATNDQFRVFNFALEGYGPHQVLRQLETGRERTIIQGYHPVAAFYAAIPDHVHRAAGRSPWETGGPHYEVDPSGVAVYQGAFAKQSPSLQLGWKVIRRSRLAVLLLDRRRWPYSRKDFDRFIAIVTKANSIVEARYRIPLVVISVWSGQPDEHLVTERLQQHGVIVIPIEQIIHDYPENWERYAIPRDDHFNVLGNRQFAIGVQDLLERRLLGRSGGGAPASAGHQP
jgi:hypothetical protein